jgi:hypothetical protein
MLGHGSVPELARRVAAPTSGAALRQAGARAVSGERELEDAHEPLEWCGMKTGRGRAIRELVRVVVPPARHRVVAKASAGVIRARA